MEYRNDGPGATPLNGAHSSGDAASAGAMGDLRDQLEGYRERAEAVAGRVQDWIVENPGYAVLGAAAAGFLLARFVARRRG